jgi:hypothetical protein
MVIKHGNKYELDEDGVVVKSNVLNLVTLSPNNSQKSPKRLRSLILGPQYVMHDEARLEVRNGEAVLL